MAICVAHERCPSCAKRGRDKHSDNLGVYDDGSAFCYSCGYRRPSSDLAADGELRAKTTNQGARTQSKGSAGQGKHADDKRPLNLPKDAVSLLDGSQQAKDWLGQYDLSVQEINTNLILYSEGGIYSRTKQELIAPMIVFPVYNDLGELQLFNARNLSYEINGGTKWYLQGNSSQIIYGIYPASSRVQDTCCICEDIVSAIKIGRILPAYPLFGKNLNPNLLMYLSDQYSNLSIYLDYDAFDQMVRMKAKFSAYFRSIRCILTEHDPKYYSTDELWEILK